MPHENDDSDAWVESRVEVGAHILTNGLPTCASVMIKMESYRQETPCVKMLFLGPKCTKTHLRASLVQKNFLGSLTLAIRGGEKRGGERGGAHMLTTAPGLNRS
jgi:hypothetical protein